MSVFILQVRLQLRFISSPITPICPAFMTRDKLILCTGTQPCACTPVRYVSVGFTFLDWQEGQFLRLVVRKVSPISSNDLSAITLLNAELNRAMERMISISNECLAPKGVPRSTSECIEESAFNSSDYYHSMRAGLDLCYPS